MKYILIFIIFIVHSFACVIPSKLPVKYEYNGENNYDFMPTSVYFLENKLFSFTSRRGEKIKIVFLEFDRNGLFNGASLYTKGYIGIPNSTKRIKFKIQQKEYNCPGWNERKRVACFTKERSAFAKKILSHTYKLITNEHCSEFQPFFDKINQAEKNKAQAVVAGNAKEQKRRQALAKLAQEENYKKLKKVLKIKPEYRALLDDKTKTLLIGPYTLGAMAKAIRNGMSETSMIREIENTSFRYSSSFTFKQRNHLQEAGLSNKLIDYLELHTQEIEIQREQERRLARLERQREREIEEEQEARAEERRSARRERERQEDNEADVSRSEAFSSWQRDFQAGLDRDMNSINKNSNQFIKQYNQAQRNSRPSHSKSNYNSSPSPTYKSNYNNSYSSDVRETRSSYNKELAEIRARKMRVVTQKEEVKPKKSGKVYKTYTDFVEDSFTSHNRKSAEINVKSGLKVKANDFCRNSGWEFADTKGAPYISGCEDVNGEVKCNGRLEFGCYKYGE